MESNNSLNNFTMQSNLTMYDKNIIAPEYGTVVTTFLGFFTNILVVAAIIVSWKFWQHSIGILLLTLACVDIIGNGICFSYYLLIIKNPFFKLNVPITFVFLNNAFKRLSYMMMILISVNRYALICRPFTHRRITSQKSTLIQITTLTVFALTTGIFELFRENWSIYRMCDIIFGVTMSVALPLIITFVLTVLIIQKFRRKDKTNEASMAGSPSRQGKRIKTRAMTAVNVITRAMIVTNVAFIILTLPPTVFRVVSFFLKLKNNQIYNLAFIWLIITSDFNASVNLFIYTLFLPKFRSTLLGLFTCKCCRKQREESFAMTAYSKVNTTCDACE